METKLISFSCLQDVNDQNSPTLNKNQPGKKKNNKKKTTPKKSYSTKARGIAGFCVNSFISGSQFYGN